MGVYLDLIVSKSVTQDEWEKVYEETLHLLKFLPLVEFGHKHIDGIRVLCLVKSEERIFEWNSNALGWVVNGESRYDYGMEDFILFRNFEHERNIPINMQDPIFYMMNDNQNKEINQYFMHCWDSKTDGLMGHVYLLAIALLIVDRLKGKALVTGNIEKDQVDLAIQIANCYLVNPIDKPDNYYKEKLEKRINKLKVSDSKKKELFDMLYIEDGCALYLGFCYEINSYKLHSKITMAKDLVRYKQGNQIEENLLNELNKLFQQYRNNLNEEIYNKLINMSPIDICRFLSENVNNYFLYEEDWKTIISLIKKDKNNLKRFYLMTCIDFRYKISRYVVKAIIRNDEFYNFWLEMEYKTRITSK